MDQRERIEPVPTQEPVALPQWVWRAVRVGAGLVGAAALGLAGLTLVLAGWFDPTAGRWCLCADQVNRVALFAALAAVGITAVTGAALLALAIRPAIWRSVGWASGVVVTAAVAASAGYAFLS